MSHDEDDFSRITTKNLWSLTTRCDAIVRDGALADFDKLRDRVPTNNPKGLWRPVNVQELLTKVIVSPFAEPTTVAEAESELTTAGCSVGRPPSASVRTYCLRTPPCPTHASAAIASVLPA